MTNLNLLEFFPLGQAIGWTLLHSIWQIALVGFVLRLLLWFIPQKYPNPRYWLLMLGMFLPFLWAAYTFSGQWSTVMFMDPIALETTYTEPLVSTVESLPKASPKVNARVEDQESATFQLSYWLQQQTSPILFSLRPYLPWLALVWYAGVLMLSIFMCFGFYQLNQLKTRNISPPEKVWEDRFATLARKMGIKQKVKFLRSASISEPVTFHFFRPVVLAPVSIFTGLSTEQVEILLLHELAHIRRYDFLVNIFQSVIEVLFFYHPTVWWISGKLGEAREHCCDDLVLKIQHQPMLYAEALTHLQLFHHPRKSKLIMYANGKKGNFSKRILRLFGQYDHQTSSLKGSLVGLLVMLCLVFQGFFTPAEQPEPGINTRLEINEVETAPDANVQPPVASETNRLPHTAATSAVPSNTSDAYPDFRKQLATANLEQLQKVLPQSQSAISSRGLAAPEEYKDVGLLVDVNADKLLDAVHRNERGQVLQLIAKGVNINAILADGRTALTEAAHHGHNDMVDLLLKHGAKVNLAGKAGYTALMEAAEHGNLDLVFFFLKQKNIKINHASDNGHTALMEAAENGHYHIVKTLIDSGADLGATTHDGWNAWKEAAENGHLRVAELIRKSSEAAGISWEIEDEGEQEGVEKSGSTSPEGKLPAYLKTFMLKMPIKEVLSVEFGPINQASQIAFTLTSLDGVVQKHYKKALSIAENHQLSWDIKDLPKGNYWLTTELDGHTLREKVIIGTKNKSAVTPKVKDKRVDTKSRKGNNDQCRSLLQAVKDQDLNKVKTLLVDVNPNCTYYYEDEDPRSPLVAAARLGNLEIGKLLIAAKADVAFHARGDETALMAAAANGHLDFVKFLVSQKAAINKKLSGDGTALLVASRNGHLPVVQYLIDQGADINAQVSGDGTALICATRRGHYEVVKLLLEKGADPFKVSPGDEYAMYHARVKGNKAMIKLLKKYDK